MICQLSFDLGLNGRIDSYLFISREKALVFLEYVLGNVDKYFDYCAWKIEMLHPDFTGAYVPINSSQWTHIEWRKDED